jgi:hypothetical protein
MKHQYPEGNYIEQLLPRDGHLQKQGFGEAACQDYSVGQFLLFLCLLQRVNNDSDNI